MNKTMKTVTNALGYTSIAVMVLCTFIWSFNMLGGLGILLAALFMPMAVIFFMTNLLFINLIAAISWIFMTIVLLTYQD